MKSPARRGIVRTQIECGRDDVGMRLGEDETETPRETPHLGIADQHLSVRRGVPADREYSMIFRMS
jgi:hypothetical protein